MTPAKIRSMRPSDMATVSTLLADAFGRGPWSVFSETPGRHIVAAVADTVLGVASARLSDGVEVAPDLPAPVGEIRIVAVAPEARGRGIATRLVETLADYCEEQGASSLVAHAWVYGGSGAVPLAGVLARLGFTRRVRLEHFYAGIRTSDAGPCPQCGSDPCVCAADLYVKLLEGHQNR